MEYDGCTLSHRELVPPPRRTLLDRHLNRHSDRHFDRHSDIHLHGGETNFIAQISMQSYEYFGHCFETDTLTDTLADTLTGTLTDTLTDVLGQGGTNLLWNKVQPS